MIGGTRKPATKFFTGEEANNTLPLGKRVVADILADHETWSDRMRQYELLSAGRRERTASQPHRFRCAKRSTERLTVSPGI